MLRRARLALFVALVACTPIRGLDTLADDASRRADAAFDVGIADAERIDGGAVDAATVDAPTNDASCGMRDLCDGRDDDCNPATADGSSDPAVGTPCDGPDTDACAEGVVTGCAAGVLTCSDASGDSLEVCDGVTDEDCDGVVDEAGAVGSTNYFPDVDGDGYGEDAGVMMLCAPPIGGPRYVVHGGDCDDTNPSVRPGRAEHCDGIDEDCDGVIDDGVSCDFSCATEMFAGHTYQVCALGRPQATAASRCASYGYHLVQIEEGLENEFIHSLLASGGRTDIWLGLEATGTPPVFTWPDGSAPTYSAWDVGEPNGSGNCARFRSTGFWADAPCGNSFSYVCEAP